MYCATSPIIDRPAEAALDRQGDASTGRSSPRPRSSSALAVGRPSGRHPFTSLTRIMPAEDASRGARGPPRRRSYAGGTPRSAAIEPRGRRASRPCRWCPSCRGTSGLCQCHDPPGEIGVERVDALVNQPAPRRAAGQRLLRNVAQVRASSLEQAPRSGSPPRRAPDRSPLLPSRRHRATIGLGRVAFRPDDVQEHDIVDQENEAWQQLAHGARRGDGDGNKSSPTAIQSTVHFLADLAIVK